MKVLFFLKLKKFWLPVTILSEISQFLVEENIIFFLSNNFTCYTKSLFIERTIILIKIGKIPRKNTENLEVLNLDLKSSLACYVISWSYIM
ncbi:hypothetical protein BpHYR1_007292 [Brachionus plicatilis]|uniref:Uncharacterized protein n=1 Tax=Brachionus plicatilis TaxID=10195 RepID=A0A3M7R0F9_BRAPC|nr:hypothetical protein BpHYR1_007292 [Brachionus plicatilis]